MEERKSVPAALENVVKIFGCYADALCFHCAHSGMRCCHIIDFPPSYLLVLAEIISSTLKMEATCSSERSVATQQTTRRHIPEDDTLLVISNLKLLKFPRF
jgi:hypothetical protein